MPNASLTGLFTLQQKSSDRFLDAYGSAENDFTAVTRPEQKNPTQLWMITGEGDGVHTLQQLSNGAFLDAHQTDAKGFAAVTRPEQENDTQRWKIEDDGGNFTIRQVSSGRFLDAFQSGDKDFGVVTRPAQDNDTQAWIITPSSFTTRNVKVRLMDVHCIETEDSGFLGSEDELFVVWGGLFGNQTRTGSWELAGIDDGETWNIPRDKSVVFDGRLPMPASVELLVALWDLDHGNGAKKYKTGVEEVLRVVVKVGGLFGETVGDLSSYIADAAKEVGLPEMVAAIAQEVDGDDFLGERILEENTKTLPDGQKDHTLHFAQDGAKYRVRIRTETAA